MALLVNNMSGFSRNSIPDIPAVDIFGQQAQGTFTSRKVICQVCEVPP